MTTKNSKLTVSADVTTPATAKDLRTYENATIVKFDLKYDDEKPSVTVTFKSETGRYYTALAHPAIIWKDKLGVECTVVVYTGAEKWKLYSPTATAEEIKAYEEAHAPKKPEFTEHTADERQLAYLASF